MDLESIQSFYCPITSTLLDDPVIDREGNSYERTAIEEWIQLHHNSPITRNPLSLDDLAPNRALKDAIEEAKRQGVNLPSTSELAIKASDPESSREISTAHSIKLNVTIVPESLTTLSSTATDEKYFVLSANLFPGEIPQSVHSDIVLVIDTSGSMGGAATAQDVEDSGLSLLDMVKHAVKTVIHTLGDNDRVAVVKFSTAAQIISDLRPMTPQNKKSLEQLIEPLVPDGSTNLWDGVKIGMNMFVNNATCVGRNRILLLLTDGEPTINPPRGNLPMFERYSETNGGKFPALISTFGFGYSLDSKLLKSMAELGGGMFAFIPDSGFVGTAFVHALSNSLVTAAADATLIIKPRKGVSLRDDASLNEIRYRRLDDGSVEIPVGSLQSGQSKDFVKRIKIEDDVDISKPVVDVSLQYQFTNVSSTVPLVINTSTAVSELSQADEIIIQEIDSQIIRLKSVSILKEILLSGFSGDTERKLSQYKDFLTAWLVSRTDASPSLTGSPYKRVANISADFNGQITEALSREDWFNRWGKHYLPSLCRAHELQQCNNFKDPGIQLYGGKLFMKIRDFADDSFGNLPPPKPSRKASTIGVSNLPSVRSVRVSSCATPAAATVNMALFNNRYGGCIHGSCVVQMNDGSSKSIDALRRGDVLRGGRNIECVVRSRVTGPISMVFLKGLLITPWHPIRIDRQWRFPATLVNDKELGAECQTVSCEYVYSFIINCNSNNHERGESMVVNDIECICLAHGIVDDEVARHSYYGTEAIVRDLKNLPGFDEGFVTLDEEDGIVVVRDETSGVVVGMHSNKDNQYYQVIKVYDYSN